MRTIHPLSGIYPADARRRDVSSCWEIYHQASKLFPDDLARSSLCAPAEVVADRLAFARIRQREQVVDEVSAAAPLRSTRFVGRPPSPLPIAVEPAARDFARAVEQRRSPPRFGAESISRESVASLLLLCAGATHTHARDYPLRAAPASGALYEIEVYVAARRVSDLAPGLYHYHSGSHSLTRLRGPEICPELESATVIRELVASSAVQFFLTSVIGRLEWKYGQRAYRYTLLNAGHMAEHLCLGAAAAGLASVPYGGFVDDPTAEALGADGVTELLLHSVLIGRPPVPARAPGAATPPAGGPLLRRRDAFDGTGPEALRSWPALEARVVGALRGHIAGDRAGAREALLRCRALLPGDRTIADYCAWIDASGVAIEVAEAAILVFPATWDSSRRDRWRRVVADAAAAVKQWLGVDALPRACFDLRAASPTPQTLCRARALHRAVQFPAEFWANPPLDLVVHESLHAAYLPDNRFLAEGMAGHAALSHGEIAAVDRELRAGSGPPPLSRWLFGNASPAAGDVGPQAAATSFVNYLIEAFGRESLFAFGNTLLHPTSAAERRAAPAQFAKWFGADVDAVAQRWWHALC